MKQAVLHIGMPKAGSSSIQDTFSANRKVLEATGWRYACFTEFGREITNHGAAFSNLFKDETATRNRNVRVGKSGAEQVARYRREMASNLRSDIPLIFSGEAISGLGKSGLISMREYFHSAGFSVRLVAFVRPPMSVADSLTQEVIKAGRTSVPTAKLISRMFEGRLGAILDVFPETEFYPFARVTEHPFGPSGFFA